MEWALLSLLVLDNLLLAAGFGVFWRLKSKQARRWAVAYSLALACEVAGLLLGSSIAWVWLRSGRVVVMLCKVGGWSG